MVKQIILFFLTFIIVFLVYELVLMRKYKIKKNKKNTNRQKPIEVNLLINLFKLNIKSINYNKLLDLISVVSSIDIALIITIACFADKGYLQIIIALVIMIPIILLSYYLISLYYKKRSHK